MERRTNFLNGYLKLADIADEQEDPDAVLVYLNRALTLHSESTTAHSFMGKTMAKKAFELSNAPVLIQLCKIKSEDRVTNTLH